MTMQQIFRLALCLSLVVPSATAAGQGFPVKPVRIIVPFPPGAGPDIVARTVGQKLAEHWKHQIVVDIVKKIHSDVITALNAPEIKRALTAQGLEMIASTSEEFSAYIKDDLLKWAKVVREANVRVD